MQINNKSLLKKKNYEISLEDSIYSPLKIKALIEAFKIVCPKLGNHNIHLTFHSTNGMLYYRILNQNTIAYLDELLYFNNYEIRDSFDDFVNTINEIQKIDIESTKRKEGKRITAGFFPYMNKSDIDLSRYGIFNDTLIDINKRKTFNRANNREQQEMSESCLIHAFKSSGILNDIELNMIKNFAKTRKVPQATLKDISTFFKLHIN